MTLTGNSKEQRRAPRRGASTGSSRYRDARRGRMDRRTESSAERTMARGRVQRRGAKTYSGTARAGVAATPRAAKTLRTPATAGTASTGNTAAAKTAKTARTAPKASTTTRPSTGAQREAQQRHRFRPQRSAPRGATGPVFSVRGRRLVAPQGPVGPWMKTIIVTVVLVIAAVTSINLLSGLNVQTSFAISRAESERTTLVNEVESLTRDVEQAQSASHLAAEATKLGMVSPRKSGIIEVREKPGAPGQPVGEEIVEVRAPDASLVAPMTDANGDVRPRGATSNLDETRSVPGLAPREAAAAGAVAPNVSVDIRQSNGALPYASNAESDAAGAASAEEETDEPAPNTR